MAQFFSGVSIRAIPEDQLESKTKAQLLAMKNNGSATHGDQYKVSDHNDEIVYFIFDDWNPYGIVTE